jgi:hypothetical protein
MIVKINVWIVSCSLQALNEIKQQNIYQHINRVYNSKHSVIMLDQMTGKRRLVENQWANDDWWAINNSILLEMKMVFLKMIEISSQCLCYSMVFCWNWRILMKTIGISDQYTHCMHPSDYYC